MDIIWVFKRACPLLEQHEVAAKTIHSLEKENIVGKRTHFQLKIIVSFYFFFLHSLEDYTFMYAFPLPPRFFLQ